LQAKKVIFLNDSLTYPNSDSCKSMPFQKRMRKRFVMAIAAIQISMADFL
jgi:hypothetical protein